MKTTTKLIALNITLVILFGMIPLIADASEIVIPDNGGNTMRNYLLRIIAFAFIMILVSSGAQSYVSAKAAFSDIAGHWAESEIEAAIESGYINGYPDETFQPERSISRAEFVKIINSAKRFTETTEIPFRDIPDNKWYYLEVQKAYKTGYIKGDDSGDFRPDADISRQEVAVILDRFTEGGDPDFDINDVIDAKAIASWALGAVKKAFSLNYVSGDDKRMFNPAKSLKRCEAVKIINRVLGLSVSLNPDSSNSALNDNDKKSDNGIITSTENEWVKTLSTPSGLDLTGDTARITASLNVYGSLYTFHYIVLPENASVPTAVQIRNHDYGSSEQNNLIVTHSGIGINLPKSDSYKKEISFEIKNLEFGKTYKVYCVVYSGGSSSKVKDCTFTTLNANYAKALKELTISYFIGNSETIFKTYENPEITKYKYNLPNVDRIRFTGIAAASTVAYMGYTSLYSSTDKPKDVLCRNGLDGYIDFPVGSAAEKYEWIIIVEQKDRAPAEYYITISVAEKPNAQITNIEISNYAGSRSSWFKPTVYNYLGANEIPVSSDGLIIMSITPEADSIITFDRYENMTNVTYQGDNTYLINLPEGEDRTTVIINVKKSGRSNVTYNIGIRRQAG